MGKQNNSSVKPNWRLASKPSWRLAPKPIGWPPLCIQWTILLLIAQKGGPSHSSSCCPLIFVFFFLWAHIPHPFPIGSVSGTYVTCVWSWSSHLQYPCSAMPLWFKFECVFLHGTFCSGHSWMYSPCLELSHVPYATSLFRSNGFIVLIFMWFCSIQATSPIRALSNRHLTWQDVPFSPGTSPQLTGVWPPASLQILFLCQTLAGSSPSPFSLEFR